MTEEDKRKERAFARYMSEHQATFDALYAACPKLYRSLVDLNMASFLAGCTYEREWETGRVPEKAVGV